MNLNGENCVLGRLASFAAQKALRGESIVIVNAEKVILTGKKESAMSVFRARFHIAAKGNPEYGPKYSRMPDRVLRRAIRGMLPHRSSRGKLALRRVKVYIGTPPGLQGAEFSELPQKKHEKRRNEMRLGDACWLLGARW